MQYRVAEISDAATLAKMNYQLIRDEGHRNPMTIEELNLRMAGFLAGEYQAVLFNSESQVIGYALYKRETEWIYLRQFYINPEFRRRGKGREAMDWLRSNMWKDSPRIRLEVLVGNTPAIAFWRSVGFSDYCLTMEL